MLRKTFVSLLLSTGIFSVSYAQVPGAAIDVQHYAFTLQLNDKNDTIKGKADVTVRFLKDAGSFDLDLAKPNKDGKGMIVASVMEKKTPVNFEQRGDELNIVT